MFCSKCGIENAEDAKFCKSCGTNLVSTPPSLRTEKHHPEFSSVNAISSPVGGAAINKPAADYEIALLAIPAISTMLVWFWVSGMNLLQSPASSLNLIMLATIFGTAIVAATEASKVGMPSDKVPGSKGPVAWFFLFVLLWFVSYPAYLFKRKHFGLENRMPAGILLMLIFLGSTYLISSEIERKRSEIRNTIAKFQTDMNSIVSPVQQPVAEQPQTPSESALYTNTSMFNWSEQFKNNTYNDCAENGIQKGNLQAPTICRCQVDKASTTIPEQRMRNMEKDQEVKDAFQKIVASCNQ